MSFVVTLVMLSIPAGQAKGGAASPGGSLVWRSNGPDAGTVASLAIDPSNPDHLFAGTVSDYSGISTAGGLFVTLDAGGTWQRVVGGGIPPDEVPVVVFNPIDPTKVYAGTASNGVYRSNDGGTTWSEANGGLPTEVPTVTGIAIAPSDPRILYLALENRAVFRSNDGGANWHGTGLAVAAHWRPFSAAMNAPIAVDPNDPDRVVAYSSRTTNGGVDWIQMTFPRDCEEPTGYAFDPSHPGTIWASMTEEYCYAGDVERSTDGGATWTIMLHVGGGGVVRQMASLAIDPTDPGTIIAGTGYWDMAVIYKTTDAGSTWAELSTGLPPGAVKALAIDPSDSRVVYAGHNGDGVSKSTDGGTSWTLSSTGIHEAAVSALGVFPSAPGFVFAGSLSVYQGGMLYRSGRFGHRWSAPAPRGLTYSGQVRDIAVDPTTLGTLFVAVSGNCNECDQGAVDKSTDGGRTWVDVSIDPQTHDGPVDSLAMDPHDPNVLYAAGGALGLYKTVDGGATWTSSSQGLTGTPGLVAVAPGDSSTLYAGMCCTQEPGGVFRSTDAGATWSPANTGIDQYDAFDLAIDPVDPLTIYASLYWNPDYVVMKTTDGGASWVDVTPLPGEVVTALAVNPANPQTVYAGMDGAGIYVSHDGGVSWVAQNHGLTNRRVSSLAIGQHGHAVYVGTLGGGVFARVA